MKKLITIIVVILIIIGIGYFTNKNQEPVVVTPEVVTTTTPDKSTEQTEGQVCYFKETKGEVNPDLAFISVIHDDAESNQVHGVMNWLPGEKDSLVGAYTGVMEPNTGVDGYPYRLNILYTGYGEGIVNRQQEILIISSNDIKQGFGEKYEDKNGVYQLKDITKLTYADPIPKVNCNDVPERAKTNYTKQSDILTTQYIKSQNPWPPKVTTTKGTFSCVENDGTGDVKSTTKKKSVSGHTYCITTQSEGAAGSTYTSYIYTTQIGLNIAKLTFTLRAVNCGNYDDPKKTECEAERKTFDPDAIADTILQGTNQRNL